MSYENWGLRELVEELEARDRATPVSDEMFDALGNLLAYMIEFENLPQYVSRAHDTLVEWMGDSKKAEDPLPEFCSTCGHQRLVHGKGTKPCQAYTCKRDNACVKFTSK